MGVGAGTRAKLFYLLETKSKNLERLMLREPQDEISSLERLFWITLNGEWFGDGQARERGSLKGCCRKPG